MAAETGALWYVIGPSGAGKDSLLAYVRQRVPADGGLMFAHRYITRPADAGGENHVALSPEEFDQRERAGCFALAWRRNGLAYGLGAEVGLWLAQGLDVVVNGSRSSLPLAVRRFPGLRPLWITASPEVLAARLRARGREGEEAIARRLAEAASFVPPAGCAVLVNDGALELAGETLLGWLRAQRRVL
ncbi:phosphonate metabolism protein/1,5-bisphosphokinase (PRPP-forming) PhnN [Chromobacterium subtsugae]|uniref:Ribose 1,5-bisphosphate phosphokinase PhnN n=1 Tax=Chromobacterium subtsugae TaxID=251747 RepID=A0ABS7FIC9_9NEIS|nr:MULTISPECIES: phosphonate metabolism protein/1,5-bisphosphokinase (PRPP-forming) PhnN [Chromobacterium]KUM04702.1 ribose-phosphate pyrophosphokinase [Chromobacterium subtsugae]KZE84669.1 ribose-phosphate pyrophosphokinase [Chromobacterium sp. F49]MBW7569219.1 phosphonate metabolism protein/1,5-bisphosphokinase (PRPP-forming) PhnN [Chromobacterium subtsugae]MBW8289834.1 phosphonate metabolism protein/1,5-bisphosphokinase (PRPP-forming) PhnN [Chromobacterium subtsugae]OBU87601.1 ribose-phosph